MSKSFLVKPCLGMALLPVNKRVNIYEEELLITTGKTSSAQQFSMALVKIVLKQNNIHNISIRLKSVYVIII